MSDGTTALDAYITKNAVKISDVRSIGGYSTVRNTAEQTLLKDEWKESMPTFFGSQDITFNCTFDYAGYNSLFTALTTGTLDTYNIYVDIGADPTGFTAYVTDLKVTETNGSDVIAYDCTLRTSGAITIT